MQGVTTIAVIHCATEVRARTQTTGTYRTRTSLLFAKLGGERARTACDPSISKSNNVLIWFRPFTLHAEKPKVLLESSASALTDA